MRIDTSFYYRFDNGAVPKPISSLDERFLYQGLGKYKRMLEEKDEFSRLLKGEGNSVHGKNYDLLI